ncbi:DUF2316 family protein [Enterococcus faecium]|uniref:DUF2316 family protein n=1 Tax=Enterococcus faecium TaxID=1352 RepID=A0AB73N8N7_ENTFC|nr:DUF2316 family protein [Enterococcus faecium]EGW2153278.1 DUF2316 family protein [Enterococcus faecium]OTN99099.1 hypothetical protein A5804_000585 [Enterococcus faecium]PWS25048.1 DUF2316 domain-containing protein [Enterococcus faecium]
MLTSKQVDKTREELQENFKRLGYDKDVILQDTGLSRRELDGVLEMSNPDPGNVWMLRDYLEDMLNKEGIALYPWTRLADHTANKWFIYDTPWR